jgi:hypothetical protein
MKTWAYNPHTGGKKIQPTLHKEICQKAERYARRRPWYPKIQLKIRFKNQFCYIDTVSEGDGRVFPLCRLRNLLRGWSMALFTYSNERYEPCRYPSGEWEGTIEEALRVYDPFII